MPISRRQLFINPADARLPRVVLGFDFLLHHATKSGAEGESQVDIRVALVATDIIDAYIAAPPPSSSIPDASAIRWEGMPGYVRIRGS